MLTVATDTPRTKGEARSTGSKFYFTGKPCKKGNVAMRLTSAGKCWCEACRHAHSASVNAWQKANAGKVLPRVSRWRAENGDKERANRRRRNERIKLGLEKRHEGDPGKRMHRNALRRAAVKRATPAWADLDAIKAIYVEAGRRRALGENVHVDHIIPLQGKTVCGLHVHWNLQIIPAAENLRKQNRLIDAQVKGLQDVVRADRGEP